MTMPRPSILAAILAVTALLCASKPLFLPATKQSAALISAEELFLRELDDKTIQQFLRDIKKKEDEIIEGYNCNSTHSSPNTPRIHPLSPHERL